MGSSLAAVGSVSESQPRFTSPGGGRSASVIRREPGGGEAESPHPGSSQHARCRPSPSRGGWPSFLIAGRNSYLFLPLLREHLARAAERLDRGRNAGVDRELDEH